MKDNAQRIDISSWPRREAYEFFSNISDPFYMVTFRQDVTRLYEFTKANGLSFYYAMVWACSTAVNETEAFRAAIRNGEPVLLPERRPSFTDLRPGAEQFHIVTMDLYRDIVEFCRKADALSRAQDAFINASEESDELIYISCLPWVELTALTNERDLNAGCARDDSIPRIAWGRFTDENGKKTLGLSLEVNHRLIDGLHIGRFAERLTRIISEL
ncbi:MAG: hypothetical protein IKG85_03870 [Clostridia bacterium]|nr:hypothetical protein [Clostridia bacterium]